MTSILFFLRVVALCLFLAQSILAGAQTGVQATLPPAAQEALNKGIIAAKVPDYLLAIRYFEEARKIAPLALVVFLNLGLAESRVPSRELRAMAWFGAYLAAYPDAPNAAAVKEQIAGLEVRNQSNVSRFIKAMEDAANRLPKSRNWLDDQWFVPDERRDNLIKVAELWQNMGDFSSALRVSNGFTSDFYRAQIQRDIGLAQKKAGDLKGAQRTFTSAMQAAGQLQLASLANALITSIAYGHAQTGDITGALQSTDGIKDEFMKSGAQVNIGLAQFAAGDATGGQRTFSLADQTADRVQPAKAKDDMKLFIVEEKRRIETAEFASASRNASGAATLPSSTLVSVSDWINKLDDDNKRSDCALNTEPFLDLAAYLTSLPAGDSKKSFSGMAEAAEKIVKAQSVLASMLRQQAQR